MRQFLDRLYTAAGALAALCLIILLCIIVAQMISRWLGISFPGSTAYVGYFMAASSFLAFAYALNADSHIRVSLFLNALGTRRYWLELWCFAIGSAASCYLAFYAVRLVQGSIRWNDISQDRDA
ncbi:MAG: TRAP transporter small permease subunit, partial [Pseudomonadota bacterium]